MRKTSLHGALGLAIGSALLVTPAQALGLPGATSAAPASVAGTSWHYDDDDDDDRWDNEDRWDDDDDRDDDDRWERLRHLDRYFGRQQRRSYNEPVYRDTRVWRGRDGRVYCRKRDGTTGLIVGGALGAILGREIDSRGDLSLSTILGAAGGALLGREVTRGSCR